MIEDVGERGGSVGEKIITLSAPAYLRSEGSGNRF